MSKTRGIYVCVFSTGTVKIGMGSCVETRIASHKGAAKCFGVSMLTSSAFPCGDIVEAERELIRWCGENSDSVISREWYQGIDVGACQLKAQEIAEKHAARPEPRGSRVFERIQSMIVPSEPVTKTHAAYIKGRQMVTATGVFTEKSLESMDKLHELCECIRDGRDRLGMDVPVWFDNLDCMEPWEVTLMLSEGLPDAALVEDVNRALTLVSEEVRSRVAA